MSSTSEALNNARQMLQLRGGISRHRRWLKRAAEFLPQDIMLPEHIEVRADVALWLKCGQCSNPTIIDSVSQAADFRDRHYHCGEATCDVWRCPMCDCWEFAFQADCRFCGGARDEAVPTGTMRVDSVLRQCVSYGIYLPGNEWRATIRCNSLLRAKQAARAMYPRQEAEVRSACGRWDSVA